jgi:Fe-coproporphyrin III synthase
MFAQHGSEASVLLEDSAQRIVEMPILVLNAHGRCNCRCVMCDIWKREEGAEIRAADLERHRSSLRRLSVRWVVVSGGEPLMHSDLRALCTFFRELDIRLTLLTTGLLLTRRAGEVCELFDDVIVSVDGPAAVHDGIRRVKNGFYLIQSGIAAIRQFRSGIRITGRTTVQRANHRHLQDTVLTAKTLGLDSISFLAADVTSEAFNRPLIWPGERQSEVALSKDEVCGLEQEIEELIGRFGEEISSGYIAESTSKLRRIVTHFQAHLGQVRSESPPCNAPWVSAVIEADGAVRPCFFHPPIGNIHGSSLEQIVNGDKGLAFRRNLNIADDPTCRRCVCSLNHRNSQRFQE